MASESLIDGKACVVLSRDEYDRLTTLAKAVELPPLPPKNARGNYPAVEYARVSLARRVIQERVALGLTQRELAKRAGVRLATLRRFEAAQVSPSLQTVEKVDRALRDLQAAARATKRPRRSNGD